VSNINYLSINENFPVAGQDNDTQTFRDNFDTIKTSLRLAKEEVTELQNNSATLTGINDFNENIISNAVLQNNKELLVPLENVPLETATSNVVEIDYQNGSYQTLRATADIVLEFTNFPGDPTLGQTELGVGRMTLEFISDGTERTITFATSSGTVFKKDSEFPPAVTAVSDPTIIEIWRHRSNEIFLRYLGRYSE
jgi:hypothetical protein